MTTRFTLYLEDDSQDKVLESALDRAGVPVVTCRAAGMNGKTDAEQLGFAAENGYVLCTANVKDFEVLHRLLLEAGRSHAGIIYRTAHRHSAGERARRIIRIWQTLSAEEMVNRVVSLSQWGADPP